MSALKLKYYQHLIREHLATLTSLQYESGLFAASSKKVSTGYDKSWLRDNFYECLAYEQLGDWATVARTYEAILGIFLKHEHKIDKAILNKPTSAFEYIHARYHPLTFDEFWEDWGNKQNDAIGAILYKLGELEHHGRLELLNNPDNVRIVQKMVQYLESIQYWKDPDNGVWENEEEIHASSIGACVAGLQSIKRHTRVFVPQYLIAKGLKALHRLLPRESAKKFVDLAELSLIYPYDIVTSLERDTILTNIEYHLKRDRGLIRYRNDWYYNKNKDGYSEEAEWTFGFPWLSIIYYRLGDKEKAKYYLQQSLKIIDEHGQIPELYYSNSPLSNENSPLGWGESLFIIAVYQLMQDEQHEAKQEVRRTLHVDPLSQPASASLTSSVKSSATRSLTPNEHYVRYSSKPKPRRRRRKPVPFVLGELNTRQSILIDAQLRKMFDRLNQSTTSSYSPYSEHLSRQVREFVVKYGSLKIIR